MNSAHREDPPLEQDAAAIEHLRLAVVLRDSRDALTVKDLAGRLLAWNSCAVRLYGWSEAEALPMNTRDRIPPAQREQEIEKMKQPSRAEIPMIATALLNEAGQMYGIATTERVLPS